MSVQTGCGAVETDRRPIDPEVVTRRVVKVDECAVKLIVELLNVTRRTRPVMPDCKLFPVSESAVEQLLCLTHRLRKGCHANKVSELFEPRPVVALVDDVHLHRIRHVEHCFWQELIRADQRDPRAESSETSSNLRSLSNLRPDRFNFRPLFFGSTEFAVKDEDRSVDIADHIRLLYRC